MWYLRCPLPMPPAVCLQDSRGGGRITHGSSRALTTLATQCSLTYNLVRWARYLMKEKSFQFQKLYQSAVSWEISIDTKIPLKAPEHFIVPNRRWCPKKENAPLSIQRISQSTCLPSSQDQYWKRANNLGFHTCAFPQPHEIIKTQGSSLPIRLHGRIKTTTKKSPKPKTIHCIYPGETALAQFKIADLMLPQSLKWKSY